MNKILAAAIVVLGILLIVNHYKDVQVIEARQASEHEEIKELISKLHSKEITPEEQEKILELIQ